MTAIQIPGLLTLTIAILVYFAGSGINRSVPLLSSWNIPEAVTGGLLAALITLAAFTLFGLEIHFTLEARDLLLLYFFTGIGLNARMADLRAGGWPLVMLLGVTLAFLVIQNVIAIGSATALGLPAGVSIFLGSASLIGGHGTSIAWAPTVSERFDLSQAMEIGVASATLGLVIASIVGGPVARFLIKRHGLIGPQDQQLTVGVTDVETNRDDEVSYVSLLRTLLVMNIAILIAYVIHELISGLGVRLPLFVICMLVSIAMTNVIPPLAPRLKWPTRTRALALISDLSLNVFLAMSLMSMQLWTIGELGLALIIVLALQTVAAIVYIMVVVFPVMGRTYDAAVISAGFGGIALGATPTAIANMTAITKVFGAAPIAFMILPLVSAFFIDIANAAAIGFMVR